MGRGLLFLNDRWLKKSCKALVVSVMVEYFC